MAKIKQKSPREMLERTDFLKSKPIQFDGDCIDTMAKRLLLESLNFTIETSLKKLNSLAKVQYESAATGKRTLGIMGEVYDAILEAPICPIGAKPALPPKPESKPPTPPTPLPAPPATKPSVTVTKPISQPVQTETKTGRGLAGQWPEATWAPTGEKFSTLADLFNAAGIEWKGKHGTMVEIGEKAGLVITGNGEPKKIGAGGTVLKVDVPSGAPVPELKRAETKVKIEKEEESPATIGEEMTWIKEGERQITRVVPTTKGGGEIVSILKGGKYEWVPDYKEILKRRRE